MFAEPIAYFLTWTTYGSWLPGDERGWVELGKGHQPPDATTAEQAASILVAEPVTLINQERQVVDGVVVRHCEVRGWTLHAKNVRTRHIHVVVTAPGVEPEVVREQLKAWCSRRLSEAAGLKGCSRDGLKKWWTEKGSIEIVYTADDLVKVIDYVENRQ